MDSLTQIVLGAAVGEATLGRKIGNKALLYGAIAGTIPDLDVIANYFTDTITATELHRGFSHSIVFCLLAAPILGGLVNKLERKHNLAWKPWAKLFFWCLFTHPLLDAFTTWGTQLLWPFDIKLAFNSIFVIDPFYTLPFLILTIILMFYKRTSHKRRQLNRLSLIVSSSYLFITVLLKFHVHKTFENALEEQNIEYTQISTRPSPMNTILWNANIDTPTSYWLADYSFFDGSPITFKEYPKNREVSDSMLRYNNVQRLIDISEGWYLMEQQESQWYFYDLRFGQIPKRDGSFSFVFAYALEEHNGVIIATEVPKTRRDAKFLMKTLWERIKGN